MIAYPSIDPAAFTIGPFAVRWYGLMYLFGFIAAWLLARSRMKKPDCIWTPAMFEDLFSYSILGVILGGRIGYTLFYESSFFLSHPLEILKIWNGGMSFHGGLLGVIFAMLFFARQYKLSVFAVSDFVAPLIAPGLFFGRLGNFINGELWGNYTAVPWGMVFPGAGPLPRHPSQLYEAALEGVLMFIILWVFSAKKRAPAQVSALFLICYGSFRFFVEFFREPDAHLGYLALGWVSMGQILCLPMILGGMGLWIFAVQRAKKMQASK